MSDQDATTHDGHRLDTSEQAGEQMPMPVRCDARKGKQVGGAAGRARAFLETARASSKTCTGKESYRAAKQREKRPESDRQHFVLPTRDRFFSLVLLLL